MTRIDKAYSLLFHPLREKRGPKRTLQCVSAWIASFGVAPAIVGCIKKHRVRAEKRREIQLTEQYRSRVERLIEHLGRHTATKERMKRLESVVQERPNDLTDKQKDRIEAIVSRAEGFDLQRILRPTPELLTVFNNSLIRERLSHYLGEEFFKLAALSKPYEEAVNKEKLQKIKAKPDLFLQELGLKTIEAVISFTDAVGKELTTLDLTDFNITDDELDTILDNCPLLTEFAILSTKVTHEGIRSMAMKLKNCKTLSFIYCDITDADVKVLAKNLPQLTYLDLSDSKITDNGVLSITKYMKGLKALALNRCNIGRAGIKSIIENLENLEELALAGCPHLVKEDFLFIASTLTQLKRLELSDCLPVDDEVLTLIAEKSTQLEHLELSHCAVTKIGIIALSKLQKNLTFLDLNGCVGISNAAVRAIVKHLQKLKTLKVASTSLGLSSPLVIASNLHHLTHLDLRALPIGQATVDAIITHQKNLKDLNLTNSWLPTNASIRLFQNLTSLKSLECTYLSELEADAIAPNLRNMHTFSLSSGGFINISENLQSLRHLTLRSFLLYDETGPDLVKKLPNLVTLNLSGTNIGNKTAAAIGKNLQYLLALNLTNCSQLKGKGIINLAKNQKRITFLNLNFNPQFRDKHIVALTKHIPHLKRLHLDGCFRLTNKSVQAIKENLQLNELTLDEDTLQTAQETLNQV